MFQRISLKIGSNIILAFIFVAIPFLCYGATYDLTVGESISFTPFSNPKYRSAIYSDMTISGEKAFDISYSTSSSNPYNKTYKLKALKTGSYTVYFKIQYKDLNSYIWDTFTHTLNVYDVSSISIPSTLSLIVGEKYTYSPVIVDKKAKAKLDWSSDNADIVSVEGSTITARSVGEAIITCTAQNGVKAISRVTVSPVLVQSISLNYQEYDLPLFTKLQLTAEISPSNAADTHIQWTSSNNEVAIVREDGLVIGINCGFALISAKANDASGISASCLIKVVEVPHEVQTFSVSDSECGKIEIKYDDGYFFRLIPFEGWQIYSITAEDGTALSNDDMWITISKLEEAPNYTIIWEKIPTDIPAQFITSKIFNISNRTIEFIDNGFKHLGIYDTQGRMLYQGPCRNIHLQSSGNYIINIDNNIFKIFIP